MTIGPPEFTAGLLLLVLNAYVLTGGADFGGGVWDLLASGPRRDAQRQLIGAAIGPIWEANHVWLVIAVVMCFTGFPAVFATLGTVLHIPLALALLGIVFRGTAFVFRSAGQQTRAARRRWSRIFAIASTITPLVLGTTVGALATGAVGIAQQAVGRGSFFEVFVAPWLAPFPIAVGLLTVTLFALLAATYLTLAAKEAALREDFRRRALAAVAAVIGAALATALVPGSRAGTAPASALWPVAAILVAGLGVWALGSRRFRLARVAVAAQVSLVLWGWAAFQYPYLVPNSITIRDGAAPQRTLLALLWVVAIGGVLLLPALAYLLRLFATYPPSSDGAATNRAATGK